MNNVQPEEGYFHSTQGYVKSSKAVGPTRFEVLVEYTLHNSNTLIGRGVVQSSSRIVEGDRLLVHYNLYEPSEFTLQEPPLIKAEFLIFIGIMIGGLGFRFFIRSFFAQAKKRFIQENGRKIVPLTTERELTYIKLFWVLKLNVVRIHCTWKKPDDTDELEFYSGPFPRSKGEKLSLKNVKIYFLPQAPERYYIDLSMNN